MVSMVTEKVWMTLLLLPEAADPSSSCSGSKCCRADDDPAAALVLLLFDEPDAFAVEFDDFFEAAASASLLFLDFLPSPLTL